MKAIEFITEEQKKDYVNANESLKVIIEHEKNLNKIGQYIYILNEDEKAKVDELLAKTE